MEDKTKKNGSIEYKDVVTVFLSRRNKILILRRSEKVGTYRGSWAGISGYLEKSPIEQAYTEILEETGLTAQDVILIKEGDPVLVLDRENQRAWRVHPFLFAAKYPEKIRLDWENVEMRWVRPDELKYFNTVPDLDRALESVFKE
nr:NUDIX pyrophosphatase [Desulfobacterales bacterium]